MALESLELRKSVSRSSGKTKSIIVIGGIVLTIIVVFGVFALLSSSVSSSDTKRAVCTAKVLELAQKGIIREVGGYSGAIFECTHMTGWSSVYGKASS
ncbi:MAG: hypothetical protein DLM72_17340 [Candidatus Nitrosopolaris wilkensis]|nr:MAG: hypothetical protein DLM72_17340 [Candidatus Nitrosopolaris wilkensis]